MANDIKSMTVILTNDFTTGHRRASVIQYEVYDPAGDPALVRQATLSAVDVELTSAELADTLLEFLEGREEACRAEM